MNTKGQRNRPGISDPRPPFPYRQQENLQDNFSSKLHSMKKLLINENSRIHPFDLTLVIPVYKNADTLQELHQRLGETLKPRNIGYEILFVIDDCPQNSLAIIEELVTRDTHVCALVLSPNIGQQRAILAGLPFVRSRSFVIMDADLQDPPEAIPSLLEKLDEGYDVVFAGRRGKYESAGRLVTSRLYKLVIHILTGIPDDAGVFLAARQSVIYGILDMETTWFHTVATIGALGISATSIPVERAVRRTGGSAYTSWMRLQIGLHAAFWTFGWKLGIRPVSHTKLSSLQFPIKARLGARFR